MIDPIIFQFKLFNMEIILRWYGVLVMLGAVIAALIAKKEIERHGENGEVVLDAMVWVLPIGILGARAWYVINNILGGGTYYIENPIKTLYVWEGGLHIFGGFLFGVIALYFFLKSIGKDVWLFLDALAPAILIGQAIGRIANYINQELYGPPTKLPWGIPIDAAHRLTQFADLGKFPVETTRFHPTFAYELILNILLGLLLLWIARSYQDKIKPGTLFTGWLISAGLARTFIEFFRPDQPRIGNSFVTFTMVVSFTMAVIGVVLLLARYGKLQLAFAENWEEEYQIQPVEVKERVRVKELSAPVVKQNNKTETISAPAKKKTSVKTNVSASAKPVKKITSKTTATKPKSAVKKTTTKPKTTKK